MTNDSPVTAVAMLIEADGVRVAELRDRAVVRLGPGERCEIPAGAQHRLRNALAEESRYLVVQGVGAYDFVRADEPSAT